jgi:multiple sugar transport system permease protein
LSHELLGLAPHVLAHEWELRAYRKLFYETNFWVYFQNTIVVSATRRIIVILAGVIGAYSLTRYAFRGRTLVARLTLLAYMFPPIIMLVPLFLVARQFGSHQLAPRASPSPTSRSPCLRIVDP